MTTTIKSAWTSALDAFATETPCRRHGRWPVLLPVDSKKRGCLACWLTDNNPSPLRPVNRPENDAGEGAPRGPTPNDGLTVHREPGAGEGP